MACAVTHPGLQDRDAEIVSRYHSSLHNSTLCILFHETVSGIYQNMRASGIENRQPVHSGVASVVSTNGPAEQYAPR